MSILGKWLPTVSTPMGEMASTLIAQGIRPLRPTPFDAAAQPACTLR
jgi:hypothetical protein